MWRDTLVKHVHWCDRFKSTKKVSDVIEANSVRAGPSHEIMQLLDSRSSKYTTFYLSLPFLFLDPYDIVSEVVMEEDPLMKKP